MQRRSLMWQSRAVPQNFTDAISPPSRTPAKGVRLGPKNPVKIFAKKVNKINFNRIDNTGPFANIACCVLQQSIGSLRGQTSKKFQQNPKSLVRIEGSQIVLQWNLDARINEKTRVGLRVLPFGKKIKFELMYHNQGALCTIQVTNSFARASTNPPSKTTFTTKL